MSNLYTHKTKQVKSNNGKYAKYNKVNFVVGILFFSSEQNKRKIASDTKQNNIWKTCTTQGETFLNKPYAYCSIIVFIFDMNCFIMYM